MVPLLFVCLVLSAVNAQAYCRCGSPQFVLDMAQQCFTSASYDVQNACFNCPVSNTSGTFYFCASLYGLGYAVCGQSGALAAMQQACTAIGGNPASSAFICRTSAGTNQSQVQACSTPSAPISVPPSAPSAATSMTPYDALLVIGLVLFCYVTM